MTILTAHFGEADVDSENILNFEQGLPGLEEDKRFALLSNEDSKPVCWLQSLDHREIALPVIDPFTVCPDYSFDIAPEDAAALEVGEIKDVYVLSIMVIPESVHAMTVNLSAPIIINVRNKKAKQIILDDRRYRMRVPVAELLGESVKGGI
ncbi:MAG: flagellar assembly protein FliW [Clostridiales bacterium]|nr:flagellar assembly protein FliW [Clostridiales bacterium]